MYLLYKNIWLNNKINTVKSKQFSIRRKKVIKIYSILNTDELVYFD